MTVDDFRNRAWTLFALSTTPLLDAECILSHVMNISRSEILSHTDRALTPQEEAAFWSAAKLRKKGLPIAYITGVKEFFGYDYLVTPAVLIPKPDTELLVEKTLDAIKGLGVRGQGSGKFLASPATPHIRVVDVCTGSGCVAISLLLTSDVTLNVTATDISQKALNVAKKNAARLLPDTKQDSIRFVEMDLLTKSTSEKYDIIVSNPPYIPDAEAHELLADGRGEPLLALSGGINGLEITKRLIDEAHNCLEPAGVFLVEIDERTATEVAGFLSKKAFSNITVHNDLAGKPRVVEAVKA
jgi:release factor glutamine methyltransferase